MCAEPEAVAKEHEAASAGVVSGIVPAKALGLVYFGKMSSQNSIALELNATEGTDDGAVNNS